MTIVEVNTAPLVTAFLKMPADIYRHNPNWTIQLGTDIAHVFDPVRNSLFAGGDARRWLLYDNWNMPAGRIAAFYNQSGGSTTGGFGFFECTDNPEAASLLLHTAFNWLRQQGCTIAEGPINFGEKDRYWGLLTDGFDTPGLYLDNYNPAYYTDLFQRAGLQPHHDIYTYRVPLAEFPGERVNRVAKRLEEREGVSIRCFRFNELEQYAQDFHQIYTRSFDEKKRLKHVTVNDIVQLIRASRQVLDEKLIWLAYRNDEPVGLLAFMKDANQVLGVSRAGGAGGTWLKGFAFSVVPELHKKGIELGLSNALYQALRQDGKEYTLFFSGINAQTTQMTSFMQSLNATVYKTHQTFLYQL